MFTGIIKGLGRVVQRDQQHNFCQLTIELPAAAQGNIEIGASIAINGCCLTVVKTDQHQASFDVIDESLAKTNLGALQLNDRVNVERAATFQDEIGGHVVSGHILTATAIIAIDKHEQNTAMWLAAPASAKDYLFTKGFVALNGASLTIGEVTADAFSLHLIPETLRNTTFGAAKVGDLVNLEVDSHIQAIVDTVKRLKSAGQI